MSGFEFTHQLQFKIPFENEKQANIAKTTLSPDPMLKPTELNVSFVSQDSELFITFKGLSDRVIRVAANNVLENLKTVVECFEEFDGQENSSF